MFGKKRLTWVVLAIFLTADVALFLSVVFAPKSINATLVPTAEYLEQNPAPKPDFVIAYSTIASTFIDLKKAMSITISQEPFAHIGNSGDEVSQHILHNHHIEIDGTPVETNGINFDSLTCQDLSGKLDQSQQKCWSGPTEIYFDVSELSAGLHLATITIPDFDGVEHTYSWAFRYDPNAPTADPNVMPTLAVLPTETPAN
jgi:hypothetical protein